MDTTKSRKPKIGEVVCYVVDSGPDFGQIRPAKIIEIFETPSEYENLRSVQAPLLVNLKIYTEIIEDENLDFPEDGDLKFARCLNLAKLPGTWHYPKTVSPNPSPLPETKKSRIYTTSLGVMDEAYPDRVTLWNKMVWYLP